MKKYLVKTFAFSMTLSIGTLLVWGFNLFPISSIEIQATPKISMQKETNKEAEVVVLFNGFSIVKNEILASFEIKNLGVKPLKYQSFEEKGDLFHFVRFNNEELYEFRCGTGLEEFVLVPNDSIVMKKSAKYLFHDKYLQNGVFQVSFYLNVNGNEYEQFWSQEFSIPNSIKEQIKKENKLVN